MILSEQRIQIRSKSLILYDKLDYSVSKWCHKTEFQTLQLQAIQKQAYSGKLTEGAKKRLRKAIELLCMTVKPVRIFNPISQKTITHRLSFITLTVSQRQNITARETYQKGFSHFLQWLRRTQKVNNYIWKCEVQKRGQIHYHITTTSFIAWQEIRDKWNNIQRQNNWTDEYYQVHGHHDPNSTDIHEVRSVKNLPGYMMKEFTKAIQNPNTDGKVWDCSLNLKKYKHFNIAETPSNHEIMCQFIESNKCTAIPLEHCIVLQMNKASPNDIMNLKEQQQFNEFIQMIRTYSRPSKNKSYVNTEIQHIERGKNQLD